MEHEEKNNSISIKNFGPLKEANIDIAPLTVFIGPNSSGKSFAALLIHSLSNPINYPYDNSFSFGINAFNCLLDTNPEEFEKLDNKFRAFVKENKGLKSYEISNEDLDILVREGIVKFYSECIEDKLKSYFWGDLSKLKRFNPRLESFNSSFEITFGDFAYLFEEDLKFKAQFSLHDTKLHRNSLKDPLLVFKFNEKGVLIDVNPSFSIIYIEEEYTRLLYIFLASYCFNSLFKNKTHYISADRDGIIKDKQSIINKEITNLVSFSKTQKELASNLLSHKDYRKRKFLFDLAVEMEKEIIGGNIEIQISQSNEYEIIFNDKKNKFQTSLELMSTSVRELMPITYYFKYIVDEDDILIIEEPEAHIHPENQMLLTKYFVKAINKGLKIILTTHSDFIIEEFNNFIRLGKASKDIFKNPKFSEENILKHTDINVYHFKGEEYSFVPEKLKIYESGFDEENFSKVVNDLYNKAEDIIDFHE